MKVFLKTLTIILVSLYCFVISIYNDQLFALNTSCLNNKNSDNLHFSLKGHGILYHITNTGNSISYLPYYFCQKNILSDFLIPEHEASCFEFLISAYISNASNRILKFKQTDIIFPFHNFW